MTDNSSVQLSPQIREYYEKGLSALSKGNLEYAAELLFQVVCLAPTYTEARKNLRLAQKQLSEGAAGKNAGGFSKKIKSFIEVCKAQILERKDDLTGAITGYEKALYTAPKNTSALRKLAQALQKAKMAAAAIQTFEALLEMTGTDAEAARSLAQLYSSVGNYEKSKQYFEKVLEIAPNDQEANRGLKDLDALGTIKRTFEDNQQPT